MEETRRLSKRERNEIRKQKAIKKRQKQTAIRSVIGFSLFVLIGVAVYFMR